MVVLESPHDKRGDAIRKNQVPDGGWGWMVVFGRFYCTFIGFGMIGSFGVLYVELIEYFDTTRNEAAWVGSLNVGLLFLSGPFCSIVIDKLGVRKTTAIGTLLAFVGCFSSWFATGLPFLYVSLGIVLGIGSGMLVNVSTVIVLQYFDKRRSLAVSLSSSGAALSGLILPLLYTVLIEVYGWRGTQLIMSGFILNCFVCAVIFIPPQHHEVAATNDRSTDGTVRKIMREFYSLLCNRIFSLFVTGSALSRLVYTIPLVHIPDLLIQNDFQKRDGANLLAIMGVSNTLGRILTGWLGDFKRVSVVFLQGIAVAIAGAMSFVFPFLDEFYALAVAAVLCGLGMGGTTGSIPTVMAELVGVHNAAKGFGLTFCITGMTSLVSTPIAGLLFDLTKTYNASFYMCGTTFLLAGGIFVLVMVLQRHQRNVTNEEIGISAPDTYRQQISDFRTQTMPVETLSSSDTYRKQTSENPTQTMLVETVSPPDTYKQQITEIQTQTRHLRNMQNQTNRKSQMYNDLYGLDGVFKKTD